MRRPALALLVVLLAPSSAGADDNAQVVNDSKKTLTLTCADARVEVVVNGSANTIAVSGTCTKVVINGSANVVAVASAAKLAVNGSGNTLTVDAAGKIAITGAGNKLTWKRGLTGKSPKVANLGKGNKVTKAP